MRDIALIVLGWIAIFASVVAIMYYFGTKMIVVKSVAVLMCILVGAVVASAITLYVAIVNFGMDE